MKILLVSPNLLPPEFRFQYFMRGWCFPLGLAYIASFIKKHGYEVRILDAHLENLKDKYIFNMIKEYRPEVVGITSPIHTELGYNIIAMCKLINPKIVTVLGGLTPTFMPRQIMENIPVLDYIIRGEGEKPFLYLLGALENGMDLSAIKGLVYRKSDGEIIINEGWERIEDLDELPLPAKDLFIRKKRRPYFADRDYVLIEASRGCYYNCKFCVVGGHFGKGVRYRNVELVADEVWEAIHKFGIRRFMFVDNTFTANFNYVNKFIDEIMQRKIHKKADFRFMTRADCINEALLKRLKQANCIRIAYGVEDHAQDTLNAYNKKLYIEKIIDTFRLTRRAKIGTRALFIFNQYKYIDKKIIHHKIKELVDLLKILKPNALRFAPLVIFPNSPMYDEILKEGAIDQDGYKELFKRRYIPSKYLSKDEIDNFVLKVYFNFCFKQKIGAFLAKL